MTARLQISTASLHQLDFFARRNRAGKFDIVGRAEVLCHLLEGAIVRAVLAGDDETRFRMRTMNQRRSLHDVRHSFALRIAVL